MGIIENFLWRLASGGQEKELRQFVLRLKGLDDAEVGALVAYATAVRSFWDTTLTRERGLPLSLLDPFALVLEVGDTMSRLGRVIKIFQQQGKAVEAGAMMVWLHTVRAAENPDIRLLCREMWGELMRGFPHVMGNSLESMKVCDFPVHLDGFHKFPIGMEPRTAEMAYRPLTPGATETPPLSDGDKQRILKDMRRRMNVLQKRQCWSCGSENLANDQVCRMCKNYLD